MKNLVLIFLLNILFLGCSQKVTYVNEIVDENNPIIRMKHYSVIVPNGTPVKWEWIRTIFGNSNVIIDHTLNHFDKNRKSTGSVWKSYGLEIQTYSGENERKGDNTLQYYLKRLEAIKNKDEQHLLEIKNHPSYVNDGIVSMKYGNVNKYPARIKDMYKKYMNTDKYSREYFFITYSKTGKLKVYTITISVDIDKPNADDPQLLVEYSFEDMLKRSQRSLDSFVASDEDF